MCTKAVQFAYKFLISFAMITVFSLTALAQTTAQMIGEVRLVIGNVMLESAVSASGSLKPGDKLYQGDLITTPATGYAVITLVDQTKFTIKPNSQFRFSDVNNDGAGKVFTELLKGGLKTISGKIGANNPENFKINTPLGTIGIRGTNFDSQLCQDNSCVLLHEALGCPSEPPAETNGFLFVAVSAGTAYLDDCENEPDIEPGQVGVTDGNSTSCKVLQQTPCFLKEFVWEDEQVKDQALKSLEVPVLQQQDDFAIQCQGDPICIQCQDDPLCIQCQGDPECVQCQGDPICIQCLGDPLCMQCQGDPICIQCDADTQCIQCAGDPLCIQCQGDPLCIRCQGDPICINPPDPSGGTPAIPVDPCLGDPLCIRCNGDPNCIRCNGDPLCQSCQSDPICITCNSDPICIECDNDPICIECGGDQMCIECTINPEQTMCLPSCITANCAGECQPGDISCICIFEPDRPFCP